ncbi:hypothetical protein ACLKA7_017292 [Drosophila subpalustris]
MFILALFCLLAVGSQANPLQPVVEPAQHIVIVTPQAQVHLEPAVRYVHGLSPLARVSGPHHEETIVYVPAGTAASVVPKAAADAVVTGRARYPYQSAEGKQLEGIQNAQQQAQENIQIIAGQFSEAASAAASAGAGFFPGFFPSSDAKDEKNEKLELIETPANTQPLIAATEARHFYSLPQVYHTPVVDVVHTPVYSSPYLAIRARSLQADEAAPLQAIEPKPEAAVEAASAAAAPAPELPEAQPLLKEQTLPESTEQALEQQPLAQTLYPAAAAEAEPALKAEPGLKAEPELKAEPVLKAEIAARQLEESNAIKQELPSAEIPKEVLKQIKESIKESIKEVIQEEPKALQEEQQVKAIPFQPETVAIAEPLAPAETPAQPEAPQAIDIELKAAPEA